VYSFFKGQQLVTLKEKKTGKATGTFLLNHSAHYQDMKTKIKTHMEMSS
jgi:hypothetical protein